MKSFSSDRLSDYSSILCAETKPTNYRSVLCTLVGCSSALQVVTTI